MTRDNVHGAEPLTRSRDCPLRSCAYREEAMRLVLGKVSLWILYILIIIRLLIFCVFKIINYVIVFEVSDVSFTDI